MTRRLLRLAFYSVFAMAGLTVDCAAVINTNSESLITITGYVDDEQINADGSSPHINQAAHKVGFAPQGSASIYIFQLPELNGGTISYADLQFNIETNNAWGTNMHADLYGIRLSSVPEILASDYFTGPYGTDFNAVELEDNIISDKKPIGITHTNIAGDNNLTGWIQGLYDNGAQPGDFIFIRLSSDQVTETKSNSFTVTSADGGTPPALNLKIKQTHIAETGRMLPPRTTDRINLEDYATWPTDHGDAKVCLWEDDKLAAASITIDDNAVPDHSFWMEMGDSYEMKFTWFVVTQYPSGEIQPPNHHWGIDWRPFLTLKNQGHSIQSHSVHHNCGGEVFIDTDIELGIPRTDIESIMVDTKALAFAAPCGNSPGYEQLSHYYSVHRGVTGGTNKASNIDYSSVKISSSTGSENIEDLVLTPGANSWPASYRGWAVYLFHYLQDERDQTETFIANLASYSSDLWIGLFSNVAMYGQERDSHNLQVNHVSPDTIKFNLSDEMLDSEFDYPLTVKVRVDNSWTGVEANQNGLAIEAKLIEFSGKKYALVKAIPDRGEVSISSINNIQPAPGDANKNGEINIQDVISIINTLLNKEQATLNTDCNSDGTLNIRDIICTINKALQ